jgi:hypothetical protein
VSEVVIHIQKGDTTYTYGDALIVDGEIVRGERIGDDGRLERPGLTVEVESATMIGLSSVTAAHLSRPRCLVTYGGAPVLDGVLARAASSRVWGDGTRTWTLTVEDDATARLVDALDATGLLVAAGTSAVQCLTIHAIYDEAAETWSESRSAVTWYRLRDLLRGAIEQAAEALGAAITATVGDVFAYRIPWDDAGAARERWVRDPAVSIRHVYAEPTARRLPEWTAAEVLDLVETLTGCRTVASYAAWPSEAITASVLPGAWAEPDQLPPDLERLAEDYDADPVDADDVALAYKGEPTEQPHWIAAARFTPGIEASYGALRYDLRPRWDADERRTVQQIGNESVETLPLWHPQWADPTDAADGDADSGYAGRVYRGVPILLSGEDRTYVATIEAERGVRYRQPASAASGYEHARWEASHAATRVAERGLRGAATLAVTTQLAREDVPAGLRAGDYAYSLDGRALAAVSIDRALDEGLVDLELACPLSRGYAVRPPRVAPRVDALVVRIPGEEPLPQESYEARLFIRRAPADLPADLYDVRVKGAGDSGDPDAWAVSSGREPVMGLGDHRTFAARSLWYDGVTSAWSIASTDPDA